MEERMENEMDTLGFGVWAYRAYVRQTADVRHPTCTQHALLPELMGTVLYRDGAMEGLYLEK